MNPYVLSILISFVLLHKSYSFHNGVPSKLKTSRSLSIISRYRNNPILKSNSVFNDIGCSAFVLGASLLWVEIWTNLANNGKLDPKLSRKIIHCGSAPLFMCFWPLYSASAYSRLFAAIVPLLNAIRLVLAGTQANENSESSNRLATTISRSGDKREALGGPLLYTLVLLLSTVIFFRDSPVGVVGVCQMAAGDGLADIVGRRWGSIKWSFSSDKSLIGSLAFVLGGFSVSAFILQLLSVTGCCVVDVPSQLSQLFLISVICAAAELIPIGDDNITVPVVGAIATSLLIS
mmetsp:Transcript_36098/g.36777  ORF Transcript_36098/g.36777 Transcript_36098/m.36777 type:complete len:290 (-) Transcript_36098:124-993(-)